MSRNPTETLLKILTSPEGMQVLRMISPIYGDGPVALSILQAIGLQLDDLDGWVKDLWNQIHPQKATWALDLWEKEYGIGTDKNLSYEQRRNQIIAKMMVRAPMTPWRIESMISNISGRDVRVIENTGDYRFGVELHPGDGILDYAYIQEVINQSKPAYLTYDLFITTPATVKISIMTEVVPFEYFMTGAPDSLCGVLPYASREVALRDQKVVLNPEQSFYRVPYDITGTLPQISKDFDSCEEVIELSVKGKDNRYTYAMTNTDVVGNLPGTVKGFVDAGETEAEISPAVEYHKASYGMTGINDAGENPQANIQTDINNGGIDADITTQSYSVAYPFCGEYDCQ